MQRNAVRIMKVFPLLMAVLICLVIVYSLLSPFLDDTKMQVGNEIAVHIAGLYGWENLKRCGLCFYWDSSSAGGGPMYGDPYTSAFHPFVAAATLLTNPLVASNLTVIFSGGLLALAGLLYARLYLYAKLPTVWLVTMLVVGGHFTGRLDIGSIGLPLSIASFCLAVVVFLRWVDQPNVARAVQLVLAVGGLFLAGQGYLQLMFVLSLLPLGYYAWRRVPTDKFIYTALGCGIALGILMLPMAIAYAQNSPYMTKEGDADLLSVQPLGYYLMNLVIDDKDFFYLSTLSRQTYPYLYSMYIGYVTVLMALWGSFRSIQVTSATNEKTILPALAAEQSVVWVWGVISIISMLLVSGTFQRFAMWLNIGIIVDFIVYLRNVVVVGAVLAIALIMLSAHGLRMILNDMNTSDARTSSETAQRGNVYRWVITFVLMYQILAALSYSKKFVNVSPPDFRSTAAIAYLRTQPFGFVETQDNLQFNELVAANLKSATKLFYPYRVAPKSDLFATYRITSEEMKESDGWFVAQSFPNIKVYKRLTGMTPYIQYDSDLEAAMRECTFSVQAGNIDATCNTTADQVLIIHEYAFPGWEASVDGQKRSLDRIGFLTADISSGTHTISFRYRPWALIVSSILSLIGWIAAFSLLIWIGLRNLNPAVEKLKQYFLVEEV